MLTDPGFWTFLGIPLVGCFVAAAVIIPLQIREDLKFQRELARRLAARGDRT